MSRRIRRLEALAKISVAAARGRPRAVHAALQAALAAGVPPAHIDEALLQLVPFAGYARAINAFRAFRLLVPEPSARSERLRDFSRRGNRLCRRVYGPDYGRMIARMRSFHPDLADWILQDGYGKVLARPGLGARERELLAVVVLAALGLELQLRSHLAGARRLGARPAEIRSVLRSCGLVVHA